MARHYWKTPLSYIGYGGLGKQVRDMLHVDDLFSLVDLQIHDIEKFNGNTYNVGGGREISLSLKELTYLCQEVTHNSISIQSVTEDRQADIRIYITDNKKIETACDWKPKIKPLQILEEIFEWIRKNEGDLKQILN
jgi:CDP-paratose 2-epimerase